MSSRFHFETEPKRNETILEEGLCKNVHSICIHNSWEGETAQVSMKKDMDKQTESITHSTIP